MTKKTHATECSTTGLTVTKTDADNALVVHKPSPPPALSPKRSSSPALVPPKTPAPPTKLSVSPPKLPISLPRMPMPPALPRTRNVSVSRDEIVTYEDDYQETDDFRIEGDRRQPRIDGPEKRGVPRIKQNKVKLLEGAPAKPEEQADGILRLTYTPTTPK